MNTWKHLLFPGDVTRLKRKLQYYAGKINKKLGLRDGDFLPCFGFIDGTARPVCRPSGTYMYQRSLYDGHHACHAFDYQAVMTPDGIIWQLFGPVAARHTDSWMVITSHLHDIIHDFCWDEDGQQYFVYADQGYAGNTPFLLAPFPVPTKLQEKVNRRWSAQRVSIEWEFGRVTQLFQGLDHRRLQKTLKSLVGVWYPVCVLLTNCVNCLYGCQVSQYFQCSPPSLEQYLTPPNDHYEEWIAKYRPDPNDMILFGDTNFSQYTGDFNRQYWAQITERREV